MRNTIKIRFRIKLTVKKLVGIVILVLLATSFLLSFHFVNADSIEVNATFLAVKNDGFIRSEDFSSYSQIRDALTGTVFSENNYLVCGQYYAYNLYGVYRSVIHFDTSSIPDSASIQNVILSLYVDGDNDYSDTDFNVTVQSSSSYPHNPIQSGDFFYGFYGTANGGSRNTTEISGSGYWNITLSSIGRSYISSTSYTRLMLRSSNDINNVTPTGYEHVHFKSSDSGETYTAKLYVTYIIGITTSSIPTTITTTYSDTTSTVTTTVNSTIGSGYSTRYIIHGPYYEDGEVATNYVNVSIYQRYNVTYSFGLNGTDSVADQVEILIAQPALYMNWNASASLNYTRSYYFLQDDYFDEVWIFVPKTTEPFYPYTFVPTDFYGMKNPYLETRINVNGVVRTVERKSVDINQITFFMIQWHNYDLTWICDQGTYTQSFNAENTFTTSLVILSGAFATNTASMPLASAARLNSTCIHASYADSLEATYWIYLNITHRATGGTYELDYAVNETDSSYSLYWNLATNTTDYTVNIIAYTPLGLLSWKFPCPVTSISTNPFEGLFDFLGEWGSLNPSQIPAVVIIMLFLAFGSTKSTGASCLIAWIIAAIFAIMGWYIVSVPIFAFAGVTSVLVWIAENKETTREV